MECWNAILNSYMYARALTNINMLIYQLSVHIGRFRPMDNLSGGEKTVAALALLFAIHRLYQ